jgi:hypothetical protein
MHWTVAVQMSPKGTAIRKTPRGPDPNDVMTYRRSLDGVTVTSRKETIEIDPMAADGYRDWEPMT